MKSKGTIEQQIKKLERSIKKFGDQPRHGDKVGPKQLVINDLRKVK